jgi:polysaccharide pyruvyl transferase CsaB
VRKLLLLGYFGAGNLGDDALLVDWLKRWETELRASNMVCDVASSGEDLLGGFVEAKQLRSLIAGEVPLKKLLTVKPRGYHALVLPGGSVLQNATSTRSLLFYLWVIWRFTAARVPVYMLGQGLGPLKGNLANNLTALVLRDVRLLALRDQRSYDWAKVMCGDKLGDNLLLSADPVLAGRLQRGAVPARFERDPFILIVPKCPLRFTPNDTAKRHPGPEFTETIDAVVQLVNGLEQSTSAQQLLVNFHGYEDSLTVLNVARKTNAWGAEVDQLGRGAGVLAMIAAAQLVVSYRLHGLILATAYGVPALGVAYDPKVTAFCEELGLPYCTPQDVLDGKVLALAAELWQNRAQVKATMIERRGAAQQRLEAAEQRFGELLWGGR